MSKKLTLVLLTLAFLANATWTYAAIVATKSEPIKTSGLAAIAAGAIFFVTLIWFAFSNSSVVAGVGSAFAAVCDVIGLILLFIGAPMIMFPLLFIGVGAFMMWHAGNGEGAWVERGWTGLIILACGAIWLLSNWL